MRGSKFPADMHNYIWCPIYIESFMIIGSVVSEELRWQDFGTDRRTDGRSDCTPRPAFAFGDAGINDWRLHFLDPGLFVSDFHETGFHETGWPSVHLDLIDFFLEWPCCAVLYKSALHGITCLGKGEGHFKSDVEINNSVDSI